MAAADDQELYQHSRATIVAYTYDPDSDTIIPIGSGGGGGGGAVFGTDASGAAPTKAPLYVAGKDEFGAIRPMTVLSSIDTVTAGNALETASLNLAFLFGSASYRPLWQGASLNHGSADYAGTLAVESSGHRTYFIADDTAQEGVGGGFVANVVIGNPVAGGVLTIYDGSTTTGTIMFRFTIPTGYIGGPISLVCDGWCESHEISAKASVAMDITITNR